jgi:hypothetical protein
MNQVGKNFLGIILIILFNLSLSAEEIFLDKEIEEVREHLNRVKTENIDIGANIGYDILSWKNASKELKESVNLGGSIGFKRGLWKIKKLN